MSSHSQCVSLPFAFCCSLLPVALGCGGSQPADEYLMRTDMYNQPSFRAQEDPRLPAVGSVPAFGYERPISTEESSTRRNPIAADAASLDKGNFLYETYCAVCHGRFAKGDGPVAAKFVEPPDLIADKYRQVTDGYIYGIIRNGHTIMPPYAESVTPVERWHIVNYIRHLQRQ